MKISISLLLALCSMLMVVSCDKSDDPTPSGQWSNSVFIINEGLYPTGTGTVMAYDRNTGEVSADLFEAVNGYPLGNVVQSMYVFENKGYIIVNNANKIEVVNLEDFKSAGTIEGITLPRYFLGIDETTGMISCWDNTVKVINLVDYSIVSSITVGTGPDEMIREGLWIWTINSGGFGVDSTVSVFLASGDTVETEITVGHRPSGIRKDKDGKIWVLCSGKGWNGFPDPGDTPAKIVCIDPESYQIVKEFTFPDNTNHPDNLIINKDNSILYYNHPSGIFALPVTSSELAGQPFIPSTIMYYGLGFDRQDNLIYASDPVDYLQNGYVYTFSSADGSPADTIMAGIIPAGFWFND